MMYCCPILLLFLFLLCSVAIDETGPLASSLSLEKRPYLFTTFIRHEREHLGAIRSRKNATTMYILLTHLKTRDGLLWRAPRVLVQQHNDIGFLDMSSTTSYWIIVTIPNLYINTSNPWKSILEMSIPRAAFSGSCSPTW